MIPAKLNKNGGTVPVLIPAKLLKIIVKVIVMVDENGKFDYKIQKASSDEGYNEALKSYLDTQRGVPYPIPPNGEGVRYSVDFKFEG